tara:strand:- start:590 stop:793 length:204 start_codon:yes stop_codon:yes gene_type:complete
MIKYTEQESITNQLFTPPFEKALYPQNKWAQLAELIPWDIMARIYMKNCCGNMGRIQPTLSDSIITM